MESGELHHKRPRQQQHHGSARPKPGPHDAARDAELLASNNPFMPMFLRFRGELDEHHDRRERVIKASRDITALSKKMIFSLQRARKIGAPLPQQLLKEVTSRHAEINRQLSGIAPDLHELNAHRYQRNISGGLQELMEALAFQHYILTGTLLSYTGAQKLIPDGIELTVSDYILGIFDFVGEAMRFGITLIALNGAGGDGGGGDAGKILLDLRRLREEFEALDTTAGAGVLGKEVEKKMTVMKQCVEKVENAVYGVIVRGSEKPKGWVPDLDSQPLQMHSEDD
ncbi:Translin [Sphaerosporella brunnea]|uniref:Translin n=1 Tax=Sphaerosporella brunnea TaxID=1250544 RepID=A0A5J5EJ60_9PEZI|nr:Translin [Sphaerosporella brunnea]KAA8895455.1 Translin [Sphaerosporella brunnea]